MEDRIKKGDVWYVREMEDRIKIGDVWYVREDTVLPIASTPPIEMPEPIRSEELSWETDKYAFEAIRIYKDPEGEETYDDIDIKFIDKRPPREEWKEEYWDNNNWFRGVLEGNEASLSDLEELDSECIEQFKHVLNYLVEIGWLKMEK